jgi:RNA polymerase sigma-54 factor
MSSLQLRQKLGLQQRLTPQQVQYLKLLQLPAMQLEQKIKEELEENPLLEELTEEEAARLQNENNPLTYDAPIMANGSEASQQSAEADTPPAQERANDYTIEDFMNDELEGYKAPRGSRQTDEDDEREDRAPVAAESFIEFVMSQLSLQNVSPRLMLLAEEIVGSFDEDGYLRVPLEQIVQDTEIYYGEEYTTLEADRLLRRIQRLDPPGIGARDLKECLLIQLEVNHDHSPAKELAMEIIRDYYDEYANKKYDQLAKKLKLKIEDLKAADHLIQRLDPKPGRPVSSPIENTRYVTPDFYIEKAPNGKDFVITLNERGIPTLRINGSYKELAKKNANGTKPLDPEVKNFINTKFQAAKDFLVAIYQRRATLMKVMQAILACQHEFFEKGEKYLRPLIYKTVAEDVGMDISTICRVVNGKYCQCDYGVFELKYFFSESIPFETESGEHESVSNKVVKSRIRELVDAENHKKPHSDEELVDLLKSDGYDVARRTVAKYREQMQIPVARLRKRIM